MWSTAAIADLDGDAACVALDRARAALVAAEVAEFFLAAHWADLHPGEAVEDERRARRRRGRRNPRGGERGRQLGADGTPLVAEFAPMELGVHLGIGYVAAATLVRDALNVRHRHPLLWAALGRALPASTASTGNAGAPGAPGSNGSSGTDTTEPTADASPESADASAGDAADGGDGSNGSGPVGTAGRLPRVWQARQVARMCAEAGLDADRAGFVDAATTPYLGALPWGRFKELVAAKIIEADPDQAEARRRAAAAARFVRTGQSTEHGLKTLVARANAGDVILFVAMADRIAQILYLRGDRDGVDVRRSKAIGILATPARALRLLEETEAFLAAAARTHPWPPGTDAPDHPTDGAHADPTPDASAEGANGADAGASTGASTGAASGVSSRVSSGVSTEQSGSTGASSGASTGESGSPEQSTRDGDHGGTADDPSEPPDADDPDDPEVVGEADVHPSQNDADDPPPGQRPCPACGAPPGRPSGGPPGAPGPFTRPRPIPARRLLPDATLYFHLSEESLRRPDTGVARFEGVGPVTIGQLIEFLGHTNVRVVPVADLANQRPVDGYETPAPMRDAVQLRNPACIAPWGTNTSRTKDMEHVVPYVPLADGGPPGQTSPDNLAPLSRFPHRVKTHGAWTLRQTGPGAYEWRSPHGYRFAVDQHGTRPLGKAGAERHRPPEPAPAPAPRESAPAPAPESAMQTRLRHLTPQTQPQPTAVDPDALRGRVIEAGQNYEIYEVDHPLDLSAWRSDWHHSQSA